MTQNEAALALAAAVARPPKPKRAGRRVETVQKEIDKIESLVKDPSNWRKFTPAQFVYLYGWLHEKVYGVTAADELARREGLGAVSACTRVLEKEFDGDSEAMMGFMQWVWKREQEREKWRRDNNIDGRRMTWRTQFSASLLTDYRLARHRRRSTRVNE
ncbi:MAG: hypothetical protein KGL39_24795 [Patescibacteria group bacterium]|nr:hypothetical protein [Patescibacteria group bacterium]